MRLGLHSMLPNNRQLEAPYSSRLPLIAAAALLIIGCLAIIASPVQAQESTPLLPQDPEPVLYDEKEAQAIDGMLMCPVCPAETIDQAQVPLARQMRQLVRDKLSQGESREEILEYFAGVYGKDILAAPDKSGAGLVAWTAPVVGVLAALTAGVFVLRSMAKRPASLDSGAVSGAAPLAPVPGADPYGADPYLEAVDRELGLGDSESSAPDPERETSNG